MVDARFSENVFYYFLIVRNVDNSCRIVTCECEEFHMIILKCVRHGNGNLGISMFNNEY